MNVRIGIFKFTRKPCRKLEKQSASDMNIRYFPFFRQESKKNKEFRLKNNSDFQLYFAYFEVSLVRFDQGSDTLTKECVNLFGTSADVKLGIS